MKWSNETKVGVLVVGTAALALGFAWLLGFQNPFRQTVQYYVTYNFAGGIEVGSPVRVSGIKVGKVEEIEFFVAEKGQTIAHKVPGSAKDSPKTQEVVPVRLRVSVLKRAMAGVRQDSQFFINLAGIIGERYIEITPGSSTLAALKPGSIVAGVDPPRIDQLISQSFDLAGKMTEIIDRNKGDLSKSIKLLYQLSSNLNQTVRSIDKSKLFKTELGTLVDNLISITKSLRTITDHADTPQGKKTLKLLHTLLWRLEPFDAKRISKFLQEDGIRAKIF